MSKKEKMAKITNNVIDITVVLDRSGSMQSIADDTIGGFNQFLSEQKGIKGKANMSLMQFDDQFETVYSGIDIQEAPDLTKETFRPRGMTRLLDAIGKTIAETNERLTKADNKSLPAKVVMVILTDGMENDSVEYSKDDVFNMLSNYQKEHKWEFVFLGAKQDAIAVGHGLGIKAGNALRYGKTHVGAKRSFGAMSKGMTSYRSCVAAGEETENLNYFDSLDQKEQEEEIKKEE